MCAGSDRADVTTPTFGGPKHTYADKSWQTLKSEHLDDLYLTCSHFWRAVDVSLWV